jgi:hypothetical protein
LPLCIGLHVAKVAPLGLRRYPALAGKLTSSDWDSTAVLVCRQPRKSLQIFPRPIYMYMHLFRV